MAADSDDSVTHPPLRVVPGTTRNAPAAAPERLLDALADAGIIDAGTIPPMTPLTGGVSSEIWRIDLPGGPVVAKQALAKLRVAGDWRAPLERTAYEAAWMRHAAAAAPTGTPHLVAATPDVVVMEYLDPHQHRLWKTELLAGHADPSVAAAVGERLGAIHAACAGRDDIAAEFDNLDVFTALRLHPYFAATATAHADLAPDLDGLADAYRANRRTLVHGDVSPKNLLIGPHGPVFLDAECATWGDGAFDVAFVTTHLLLKMVVVPAATDALAESIHALRGRYLSSLTWEPAGPFEQRWVAGTSGMLLARVDGLSPVEYLDDDQRAAVRDAARALLGDPPVDVTSLVARWRSAIGPRPATTTTTRSSR
ncbi:phosphotransferase [Desertimonas flava]|uniref:phosphotransferase n=1 Tax=Desertimonas flava TaxID=2064846 RepID=UPI000E351A78|nr:phosphotransferase [Desertimonas flava]